jgi:hypothetical protein
VSPDVPRAGRLSSDIVRGLLAMAVLAAALAACPGVPRWVLQATRLALLYVMARG